MLRFTVILALLSHRIRTAYVTDRPTFADRLDRIYEKLEKFTVAPINDHDRELEKSPQEKLLEKLDRLNALSPEREYSDEDEELLSAMQMWGMFSAEQLDGVAKELQGIRELDEEKNERNDGEYNDNEYETDIQDSELDYPMDWDPYEESDSGPSTTRPAGITPSAFTRQDADYREYKETVVSAEDPIAATNSRPKILNDSALTPAERGAIRRAIFNNMATVIRMGKCRDPQPRWLYVRQLAPAANTIYMPPCVQLHRCAPDSGCCHDEAEVCAPVAGKYVIIPFFLSKADGNRSAARMQFFNHTQCACVSRETLQSTVRTRVDAEQKRASQGTQKTVRESQNDYRPPIHEPVLEKDEPTAPPQLRRCTCPALFLARITDKGQCSCICDWPELSRRRDCLSLARGREHFGLRDRVCVINGDCTPPTCEYGAFERSTGRCPLRRYRRTRYHHGRGRVIVEKSVEV